MEYYINLNSIYRVDLENDLVEQWTNEGWQGLLHLEPVDVRHQDGFLWVSKKSAMEEVNKRKEKLTEDLKTLRDKERVDSGIVI